jgi:uncharacterized protein YhhL (DUF1145 family)
MYISVAKLAMCFIWDVIITLGWYYISVAKLAMWFI